MNKWDADVYPPLPPASLLHQSSSCPLEFPSFGMAAIDAVSTTVASNSSAMTVANELRAAGLAVAAYEFLVTIPSEVRLYKTTSRRSLGFILFVLIRYLSLAICVFSGVGYFYNHFSPETCSHYAYLIPVFKVLQVMTSHTILGVRTYIIAWRKVWVGRTLIAAYLVALVFEWFTAFYQRYPMQVNGNCVIGTPHPDRILSAWTFYLVVMIFDTLTLSIATYYLLEAQIAAGSVASKLFNMLLYEGLGYFVALTAVNLANAVLYRKADHTIQSSEVDIAYAITLVMSQRILIHVREARHKQADKERIQAISDVSHDPSRTLSEFDIEVHIEKSIVRDVRPTYGEAIGPDGHAHPFTQGYHV